ncbi:hypothetical protein [Saccharothrix australiensis]|uniref:Uncharacterized protein n=1 Tax=Saccharothrix australiensis TaxID=2072 RepID=A0A495W357_9PSEU|nr:hypothetical protein [Saccharothrix australiensis]RKT55487.1 hypothetical protein C8E97_4156 [Saccharothrix australiensis]
MNRQRATLVIGAVVVLTVVSLVLVLGWFLFGGEAGPARDDDRFVRPDAPKASPSGSYTAHAELGPAQNGVATWVVVIRDRGGSEVFRDDYAYSTRHGVGITWLSTADQLWVLSSDVGDAHVDRVGTTWTKTPITPDTLGDEPEEIRRLSG